MIHAAPWRRQARGAVLALAGVLAALFAGPGAAQGNTGTAPAPFENTMAQRMQACTACHGPQGRAGPDGYYPRIAGKTEGYLYRQLLNFRDGRRQYAPMTHLLGTLSDDYLREIAHHFATLQVPYPAPQRAQAAQATLSLGARIALQGLPERRLPACVQCHGAALTGVKPDVPGLLGLPRDYLNSQLGAWRTGQRRAHAPDCMAQIARGLAQDEVSAVASWLAAQPLPAHTGPAEAGAGAAGAAGAALPATTGPGGVRLDCAPPLPGFAAAGSTTVKNPAAAPPQPPRGARP